MQRLLKEKVRILAFAGKGFNDACPKLSAVYKGYVVGLREFAG